MKFLPIELDNDLNTKFKDIPECTDVLDVFLALYQKVGFAKPWIAYFIADENGEIIGGAGFKGPPKNNEVEISYGTFTNFEGQGMGTEICKQLVSLANQTDPSVKITARTLPENRASIRILEKNGFECLGTIYDEEDGNVLSWILP